MNQLLQQTRENVAPSIGTSGQIWLSYFNLKTPMLIDCLAKTE